MQVLLSDFVEVEIKIRDRSNVTVVSQLDSRVVLGRLNVPQEAAAAESMPNGTGTLVVLTGQPRGGELAWHSLKVNVLDPLHADLAVLFQEPFSRSAAVVRMAKYVFSLPKPRAWKDILDQAEAKCQNRATMPHRYLDYCNLNGGHKLLQNPVTNPLRVYLTTHMLDPVCSGPREQGAGSSAIRLAQIWVLSQKMSETRLWDKYSFFIYTRTDHVHLCPHPGPSFFLPRKENIFTFGDERWGGYCDRSMVGFKDAFQKAINVTQELVCEPMACANMETCLGVYWPYSGLTVSEQPRTAFSVRAPGDTTSWSLGAPYAPITPFGLWAKYPNEVPEARSTCGYSAEKVHQVLVRLWSQTSGRGLQPPAYPGPAVWNDKPQIRINTTDPLVSGWDDSHLPPLQRRWWVEASLQASRARARERLGALAQPGAGINSQRHVTTYHSSEWETMWLENIRKWQKTGICKALGLQRGYVRAFMNDTCSARTDTPWCLIDDSVHALWYHTLDGRVQKLQPGEIRRVSGIQPISPSDAKIWSWFEHRDTITGEVKYEYIEPLVSHLRHPLARCGPYGEIFLIDRSYVLPGALGTAKKSFLFDVGASSWNDDIRSYGGPSLSYFAEAWRRYGFVWDRMEAWGTSTTRVEFDATVPPEWKSKTEYHHQKVSATPDQHPFIPSVIEGKMMEEDYVVFKLDIDSKEVETPIVEFLLTWNNLGLLDEFVWEHHVNNYLMAPHWRDTQDMSKSIADSYQYFLKLRQRGVRAHSWV